MSENNPNRRKVLKGIGAASTSSLAFGCVAGATQSGGHSEEKVERLRRAKQNYQSSTQVKKAVALHATDLLKELHQRGFLPHQSVDELDIKTPLPDKDFREASEGVTVRGMFKDETNTPTAHIQIRRQTKSREVLLIVRPEANEAHAIIEEADTGEKYLLREEESGDFVSTSACIEHDVCILTDSWCTEVWTYCCDGYCTTGSSTGDTCTYEQCCYSACCQACNQCTCDGDCCTG